MKTKIAVEKLIDIVPIIATVRPKLKADEEFKAFIEANKENKLDNVDFMLKILPLVLRNYKTEFYEILAILSDKTVDEITEQNFSETLKQIRAILSDDDVKGFFSEF